MKRVIVDLHCHSTNSDGTWSVEKILGEAQSKGIEVLAITDHDNLKGSVEAFEINREKNIYTGMLIPGIEISSSVKDQKIHLLAYFQSLDNNRLTPIQDVLNKIASSRVMRMKKMVEKAVNLGIDVSFEEVLKEASTDSEGGISPTDIISRPHFARVLVKKGFVKDLNDAFDRYLGYGKPLDVEKFSLNYQDWIDIIHNVGGVVVWAHPMHGRKENLKTLQELAMRLVQSGIDGIEYYYDYTQKYKVSEDYFKQGCKFLDQLLQKPRLLKTAGGDFHGDVGVLGMDMPQEDLTRFMQKLGYNP